MLVDHEACWLPGSIRSHARSLMPSDGIDGRHGVIAPAAG